MGTITRSFVNGLTTNGVLGASNINNASLDNITSIAGPEMTLISSATASSSASIEFSLGNFKEYKFFLVNIHPSVDGQSLNFNASTDNGSNYNVIKTTTYFSSQHDEANTVAQLIYLTGADRAQVTNDQTIIRGIGNDNDQAGCAYLHLFNPSSSTYVKHFIGCSNSAYSTDYSDQGFSAGYFNTTSPLTNVIFKHSTGNIDAGTIYMYGIGA